MNARIPMAVCPDPDAPAAGCDAAEQLRTLLAAGALPRFRAAFGRPSRDGLGDCHEVALAFMTDVVVAGRAAGWEWVEGLAAPAAAEPFEHSWLEHGAWAVDAANGKLLVMPCRLYYASGYLPLTRRDGPATRAWLAREAGR